MLNEIIFAIVVKETTISAVRWHSNQGYMMTTIKEKKTKREEKKREKNS
jgi:hypothetical protein